MTARSGRLVNPVVATTGLLVVLLVACNPNEAPKQEELALVTPVETTTLEPVDFTTEVTLTGETKALETVTVSAELPGRVLATNYEEGARVEKGQWLARVDARVDRTRIGQLQVTLEQARRDLNRVKKLHESGLSTPAELERAELNVTNAEYNLRTTRLGVTKSTVDAPIAGVIDVVHLETGEYANPGAPLATIVRFDKIIVEAGLPESKLRYVEDGKAVEVVVRALDLKVSGNIKRVAIEANRKSRRFPLEVVIDNSDGKIRPGMRADVILKTDVVQAGVLVPRTAVVKTVDAEQVVVYDPKEEMVHRRDVELGAGLGEYILVTRGLTSGETIVVTGQRIVTDGEKVKVVGESTCCRQALDPVAQRTPAGESKKPTSAGNSTTAKSNEGVATP